MLQECERVIEPLGVAVKVPEHQVLPLAAEADSQHPFAACSATDDSSALLLFFQLQALRVYFLGQHSSSQTSRYASSRWPAVL